MNWKQLESQEELNALEKRSYERPQAIFKHSTRCGVSRMALKQFENGESGMEEQIDFYYLDLLSYRPISSEIATHYAVVHESPQVLLIRNGKCVYSASHNDIDISLLKQFV